MSRMPDLRTRAMNVLPGGSTRGAVVTLGLYADYGVGARLYDIDGNCYLDGVNNYMALIHGHAHPPTVEAIIAQSRKGTCFGMATEAELELAELIAARVGVVEKIVFCSTGSEAVMHAMKGARGLARRQKIAKCEGLYHGSYDFAEVSNAPVKGNDRHPRSQPYGAYTPQSVLDDVVVLPFNDIALSEEIIRLNADSLAGIVIDLAPSRLGYRLADPAYLRSLRTLCDELGIVLIFDEVASFRAAVGGAQSYFDVKPDLVVFGKIIGGGMPIGAVGGSAKAMEIFNPRAKDHMSFTGTFNANPMSLAAGLATLRHYGDAEVDRVNAMGKAVRETLAGAISEAGVPVTVTGNFSFISITFGVKSCEDYHSAIMSPQEKEAHHAFWKECLAKGILIDVSGRANISTSFSEEDCWELETGLRDAILKQF